MQKISQKMVKDLEARLADGVDEASLRTAIDAAIADLGVTPGTPGQARLMESACKYYGYPISINGVWNVEGAAQIYSRYDICVFGDNYQNPEHPSHLPTVQIITRLKELKPAIKIFGYVPIGRDPAWNDSSLGLDEIERRIVNWKLAGATHIFLDEFGYDYYITREHQNTCVQLCRDNGLDVCANSWNIDYVFSNQNITLSWRQDSNGNPWQGNPNGVASLMTDRDYFQLENWLYSYYHPPGGEAQPGQRVSDHWRVYDAVDYKYVPQAEFGGQTYHQVYGSKSYALDAILVEDYRMFFEGYMTALALGVDAYAASILNWGAGHSNYIHYTPPKLDARPGEIGVPAVSNFGSDADTSYTRFRNTVGSHQVDIIWKQNSAVQAIELLEAKQKWTITVRSAAKAAGTVELTFGDPNDATKVFNVPVANGDSITTVRNKIRDYAYGATFLGIWTVTGLDTDKVVFEAKQSGQLPGDSWWVWAPASLFDAIPSGALAKGYQNIRRVTLDGEVLYSEGGPTWKRPYEPRTGFMYFDTTVNKPIWYKGGGLWADANGATV